MRIASTIGSETVEHDGVTYEADDKGTFEVPQSVGEELTKFGHWVEQHVADATAEAEKLAHDLNPVELNDRVTAAEDDIKKILARISKLESAADKPEPAKKAPAKKAPAKKAPAKKAPAKNVAASAADK